MAAHLAGKQQKLRDQLVELENAANTQNASISSTRNQLSDLADMRKQLSEAQAKEVKQIDAKKLEAINRQMSVDNDPNLAFILNNMAKFLDMNEKSDYFSCKSKYFDNHAAFGDAVRKMDNSVMSKEFCESLMKDITGGSSEGGRVAKALVQADNLSKYVDFYCFFKALSKMVFLAVTMRKEQNFKRKIASGQKQSDKLFAKVDMQKAQVNALDVHLTVSAEANRMYVEEEQFITEKLEKARNAEGELISQLDQLTASFFEGLPAVEE